MYQINVKAIKNVLPVLKSSLKHHTRESKFIFKQITPLMTKLNKANEHISALEDKIELLSDICRTATVFKMSYPLELFRPSLDVINNGQYKNTRKILDAFFDQDACVKENETFSSWYNHYHYLYLQENGKGL